LKVGAMRAIDDELQRDGVLLSAISAWEIGMLVAKGRLAVPTTVERYVAALFSRAGVQEEPVSSDIAERAARLEGDFHGDPADRIIVATALLRAATLVTQDDRILAYARRERTLHVVAC
jgi:PIN domain nuclease of toxin-antitoxin system